MSDSIATKIDAFSTRITHLEGQIQDLMKDAVTAAAAGTVAGDEAAQPSGESALLMEDGDMS